ncbi:MULTISPECIES: 3-deoxy-D-manno-octulosonic acid transferase [unclassified Yoonia]|uniref:3-deoxy-D-manno-octulosonic acid transferase n=1 Tax=unclassified Yoonia TaxID=2629118 RepID=UPI002AFE037C|nr:MULTISPECIES: glycosyltransferase N-terminal domain-containing protein [unclassified Yoonia]
MARSLKIAAYMAGFRRGSPDASPIPYPERPEGAIVWARCSLPEQVTAIETLQRKLADDADVIQIIATVADWDPSLAGRALPEPKGKDAIRAFLKHWRPMLAIWVRGDLDLVLLDAIQTARVPSILVDASGDGIDHVAGGWVPGAIRSLLSTFDTVLAVDSAAAEKLISAGTPQARIVVTGLMEDCSPVLPCNEADRRDVSAAIGTRPVWLAAAARPNDCKALCQAHLEAGRRAHRLLLVIVPDTPDCALQLAEDMRGFGFHVTLRSEKPEPPEPTQVFIVDGDPDLGLWYRIAPVTYLGGTLYGGGCRDPFEPAALGSAVLYGPHVAPYQRHAARLNAAVASRLIRSADTLGSTVEALLAPDKAALMAHAAWDVTSRGADVTNQIVALIRQRLEDRVA